LLSNVRKHVEKTKYVKRYSMQNNTLLRDWSKRKFQKSKNTYNVFALLNFLERFIEEELFLLLLFLLVLLLLLLPPAPSSSSSPPSLSSYSSLFVYFFIVLFFFLSFFLQFILF
jgi:hypothetical protein